MNLDLQSIQPVWFDSLNPCWLVDEGTSPLRLQSASRKCQHALINGDASPNLLQRLLSDPSDIGEVINGREPTGDLTVFNNALRQRRPNTG